MSGLQNKMQCVHENSCVFNYSKDDIAIEDRELQLQKKLKVESNMSRYEIWCFLNDRIEAFPEFFLQEDLEARPNDPEHYPGLNHATSMMNGDLEAEDGNNIGVFEPGMEESLRGLLDEKYANERMCGQFDIGKIINGRWTVTSTLRGAEGFFNRSINFVQDAQYYSTCIMKLLPSDAMHPGYAAREMGILNKLHHPNIIRMFDGHTPEGRHETPWVVTEFCNAGTLKNLVTAFAYAGRLVPELFVWEIFESLAQAVHYCHHGPQQKDTCKPWDPVSHRDIILSNVFYTWSGMDSGYDYPYTVKLADFGCAVTQSEMRSKKLTPADLPSEDLNWIPPEGPVASESADIYQIGLVVFCFFTNLYFPDSHRADFYYQNHRPGHAVYSDHLAAFVHACLMEDPKQRPSAVKLLRDLQRRRECLMAEGLLVYADLQA